ncbi:hypothetical protein BDBG_17488 [Blastomyces gilchristii SLH14081]|uniref:Uncharacterized protein n=1 Tax=Blastomyces gilchristii (strain SLH14081) TaxID=559298 RepID=A0A179UW62_BLAGS|nr:uncharacterized protein BDBG_17488 [Blastomyces gilchristii SLH14081]OAT11301.1 hypothetical protein BDBG_17488 [Blastomyces gilchristii SLH14081]
MGTFAVASYFNLNDDDISLPPDISEAQWKESTIHNLASKPVGMKKRTTKADQPPRRDVWMEAVMNTLYKLLINE